jgi:hypothetical protein
MNPEQFHSLSESEQTRFLAAFAHALTIVARDGYEIGADGVSHPNLLRQLNEIQHRVLGGILARLNAHSERYPDDVLLAIMSESAFHALTTRLHWAFSRAWQQCSFEPHPQPDATNVA